MINVFETQKKLVAAALPSGFETNVGKVLAELARPYVDEIYTDTLGNVICHKKGNGPKVMIPAHMDVIGFMATWIDDKGFIRFAPIGGHRPQNLIAVQVVFESGVHGVINADHNGKEDMANLYIDIGASSKEEAEKLVKVGDLAKFANPPKMMANDIIRTPYLDDLIACVALLVAMDELKDKPTENDLYFVFSVQEEVGCRGAKVAAYHIDPEYGIACDVCYCGDDPNFEHTHLQVKLGKGATVKVKDAGAPASVPFVRYIRGICDAKGIEYQDEMLPGGGTDANVMQKNRGGVFTTCVSVPIRGVHSPTECCAVSDVISAGKIIAAAVEKKIAL